MLPVIEPRGWYEDENDTMFMVLCARGTHKKESVHSTAIWVNEDAKIYPRTAAGQKVLSSPLRSPSHQAWSGHA